MTELTYDHYDNTDKVYWESLTDELERQVFRDFIDSLYSPTDKRKGPRSGEKRIKLWQENRDRLLAEATPDGQTPHVGPENKPENGQRSVTPQLPQGGQSTTPPDPPAPTALQPPMENKKRPLPEEIVKDQPRTKKPCLPGRNSMLLRKAQEWINLRWKDDEYKWEYAKALDKSFAAPTRSDAGLSTKSSFLFVGLDEDDIVQGRMVVKTMDERWAEDRKIKQAHVQSELDKVKCRHIVEGLYWQVIGHRSLGTAIHYFCHRFAPFGTLQQVMDAHYAARQPIPELFIWHVFKGLLIALEALKTVEIVHLAIMPSNVFLGEPDQDFPAYKTVMLGDFENALQRIEKYATDAVQETHDQQVSQPTATQKPQTQQEPLSPATNFTNRRTDWGTTWAPPELADLPPPPKCYPPQTWPIDSTTDIFTLGLLIREMMLCSTTTPAELNALRTHEIANYQQRRNPLRVTELKCPDMYSVGLADMVAGCLRYAQYKRRTLGELRRRAGLNLENLVEVLGGRVGEEAFGEDDGLFVRMGGVEEEFEVGMEFVGMGEGDVEDVE